MKHFFISLAVVLISFQVMAQKKQSKRSDTTKTSTPPKVEIELPNVPKSYDKVITNKAVTQKGLLTVHKIDDNYFWEIPDSILGREILMVTRISKSPEQGIYEARPYYAGDQLDQRVVKFELASGNRLFVRSVSNVLRSDSTDNGMYRSLKSSSVEPILLSFPVKAFNKTANSSVIDITELISSDNSLLTIPTLYRPLFKISMFYKDRSNVVSVKAFPKNVEIRTMKTFASMVDATGSALTFEFNNSFVLLPKVPMRGRKSDARVGYFTSTYANFKDDIKEVNLITRWRLEPKPEDVDRYLKGELVEPQKPIVIYIDPATPKKWVPYLIKGVNDWQVAFEKAGFKNAILAKEAPLNDTTWSLEDATHSAIVYKPSLESNAMGPHIHDPRSGEILETHIQWYHNVMSLLRNWYMLQAGAIDPRARKLEFDDELMGELIRFVSSHEVGHTLGLMHNFGSSSTVSVDSLRNKQWVEKYGHTPSIMDYARFNYVAQPEDKVGPKGIYPRVGDYDKWAIEYGYRYFPEFKDDKEEQTFMNNWVVNSLKNKRLWYGPQTVFTVLDPRSQNEDLGDDAMKAGAYGIKNLKRILPNLQSWTSSPNSGYAEFTQKYDKLVTQVYTYAGHVINNIGGAYKESKTGEQGGIEYTAIPLARQKRAMKWLNDQIFITPNWLSDKQALKRADPFGSQLQQLGAVVLTNLMSRSLIIAQTNRMFPPAQQYDLMDFWDELKNDVWKELNTGAKANLYRRNLQSIYISNILGAINSQQSEKPDLNSGDYFAVLYVHANKLLKEMQKALPLVKDKVTYTHLKFTINRFKNGLERGKTAPPAVVGPKISLTDASNPFHIENPFHADGLSCSH